MEMAALNLCEDVATVVNLHAVYKTKRDYTFILDYLPKDLHSEVEKDEPMNEAEVIQIIRDLLKTLNYLHERQIIHLDLKPENILIDEEKKIYLCDFGMSKMLENSKETCRVAGTTEYCSPEQIQFEPLSAASDMWAVGVIAFVLLSKTSPFENGEKHETQNAVINCIYDFEGEAWSDRSALAKSFIQTLLIREPKKRASASEALLHPWLESPDKNGAEMAAPPKIARRLSKRSSSVALFGLNDINLNRSLDSAVQEVIELPPKKIKSDSQE
ncbi:Oidioi.mRNA.OKI2018_I69.chr2.g6009.t1.cds [Oikopleura dioica]|uniref:Oidioi.mRNA.OKI2018_I69.chr2.g6009.t1.cds n=1 Tax=Oikopleura dioica TaxID=34765 RepID=A0ABN7T5B9_OIKDI|nr:Oidioi.mRNA.OKI2018_I69.chr2.g6009.t1.cds [Oikopleura dioica]